VISLFRNGPHLICRNGPPCLAEHSAERQNGVISRLADAVGWPLTGSEFCYAHALERIVQRPSIERTDL
jgi:hypothetical protein